MENISQNAMKYCIRGKGGSPKDKPQVYLAYHPADYKLYFREITDKILEYADCAVFYHEDPHQIDMTARSFDDKLKKYLDSVGYGNKL